MMGLKSKGLKEEISMIRKLKCRLGFHKKVTTILYSLIDANYSGRKSYCLYCDKILRGV